MNRGLGKKGEKIEGDETGREKNVRKTTGSENIGTEMTRSKKSWSEKRENTNFGRDMTQENR